MARVRAHVMHTNTTSSFFFFPPAANIQAFVITDRTNDRTLTLPGDFDTFVSDAETRQEESQATLQTGIDTVSAKLTAEVEASEKRRREEEVCSR